MCLNCQADNNRDYPMCQTCEPAFHFPNRADCHCASCEVKRTQARIERQALAEIIEINGLSEPTQVVIRNVERNSISRSTRIIGNYAYFPQFGWRRYVTLASATWNQYMY